MYAPGDFRVEKVPVPEIEDGKILTRILGAGICAGDVNTLHGGIRIWGISEKDRYNGTLKTGGVINHQFALTDWQKAFETAEKDPDAAIVALVP